MKNIPRLTYQQYRAVRRLVHECCNYDGGNCLALDDGWEPCVCVQSISYSLVNRSELVETLLDKSCGIFRVPPDLHGGGAGQRNLQHDLHELVNLRPVGGHNDQFVVDLSLNISPLLKNFLHSFHGPRWNLRRGGRGRE